MPGTEITIAEKTWELKQLKGLKAIKFMPKVISIAAELLWAASNSGFDLGGLFDENVSVETIQVGMLLRAAKFVADALGERYDELTWNVLPFLLQAEAKWLNENGTVREIVLASWTAIKFHIETSFGSEVIEALKKSIAAEQTVAEAETDLKSSDQ